MVHIGAAIKKIMADQGITQVEVARHLDADQGQVSRMLGQAHFRTSTLERLAAAVGVSPSYILRMAEKEAAEKVS